MPAKNIFVYRYRAQKCEGVY